MKPKQMFSLVSSNIDKRCLFRYNIPLLIPHHLLGIKPNHYPRYDIAEPDSYHDRIYCLIIIKQPPIFIQTLGCLTLLPSDLKSFGIVPLGLAVDKN